MRRGFRPTNGSAVVAAAGAGHVGRRGAAQETTRNLSGPGQHSKFLTHNQRDRWRFAGERGETIIAHVVSREFDPVLELAKDGAGDEEALLKVDDPGSESRFAIRLPDSGKYEIRVHAFKYQGGGNYTLSVQRFEAQPLEVGKPALGAFDREGKSYWYFSGVKDQVVVPDVRGSGGLGWQALNPKGKKTTGWAGAVPIEDGGECYLIVSGPRQSRYQLRLRVARPNTLEAGKTYTASLEQGGMDVWNYQGKPGEFRLLEVEEQGQARSRFVFAPTETGADQRLAKPNERPAISLLPVASRGGHLRYAAFLGARAATSCNCWDKRRFRTS